MVTTANLLELQKLINSEHGDPHHILGMHEVIVSGHNSLAVRAFIPQAKEITVIDDNDETKTYEMTKIHDDGFFEVIIKDREEWFMYKLLVTGYTENTWTMYDPYSFGIIISEMDLHLFGEGTHYKIFEKLGAHIMEHQGVKGVHFAVWAPNAKRVSVIGDFNSWDGRRSQMRLLNKSGIWELFVPGLKECDKYKFEIKTHWGEVIEKSDPYGNFAELRPSTTSLVYDINKYKWNDDYWIKKRNSESPLNKPINIYEVHLGSWKRVIDEDYRFLSYIELAEQLIPYVKEMGYTHIELMPIEEHPYDGSWGYQVTGYYAPTSRYGNPEEFMYFIDKCHQNDIGVILDWVPAHFPKDAHGLARFDGTALYEHQDPKQGEHPEWGTLIFNFGRKEVKNFLIGNAIFWLEKYHLDGLRVDAVASMIYLNYAKNDGQWVPNQYGGNINLDAVEFVRHMNSVILGRSPHVLMIAEESTSWQGVSRPVEENGLGFNLKWNMGWMNDILFYVKKECIHRKYHHNNLTFGSMYAHTENFVLVLSHDEVVHLKRSLVDKMPGDLWQKFANLRVLYGYMYGHLGKKLLFMGGEFAQFAEWDEKKSIDWFLLDYEHHRQMQLFVKELNNFYKEDKPLWHDDFGTWGFEWIQADDAQRSIVSFYRKCDNPRNITIFICNFTPETYLDFRVGVPFEGKYIEVLNSDNTKYGGSGVINTEIMVSQEHFCDNRHNSISLKLPPLAVSIIKVLE